MKNKVVLINKDHWYLGGKEVMILSSGDGLHTVLYNSRAYVIADEDIHL